MRPWAWMQTLFAPADEGEGGTGVDVMEHEFDEPEEPAAAAKAEDPAIVALKADVERLKTESERNAEDARYWAGRAQRTGEPDNRRQEPEPDEPEETPRIVDEKPENLLDDMTARGLDALADRGIVTKKDLKEALAQVTTATSQQIQEARADAEFGLKISDEFPEFAEESRRIDEAKANGSAYRPTDPHFLATGKIAREAAALNGGKLTAGIIIMAARQARAEMKVDGTWKKPATPATRQQTQDTRRARIDRLNPQRAEVAEGSEDGEGGFTADQLTVMKNLKVKPEVFRKQASKPTGGRQRG